ncbi:MAG TPA: alpha/beta fold hydrolase [Acidimicrobiales bacterium]|nr:alpha/beta fold hydrolase [Acidimicrobiales bacterium]
MLALRRDTDPVDLAPPLPQGRLVELPGRGTTFYRHVEGPPDAPTLLLLHGLSGSADLNWFPAYDVLAREFNVLAIDHRGHGRGIRSPRRFRLADCADDAIALADVVGVDRVIAVGYSMGGPIAQLAWQRHRDRVAGLVLAATSRDFRGHPRDRLMFAAVPTVSLAARVPPLAQVRGVVDRALLPRLAPDWLVEWAHKELRRNDPVKVLQAAQTLGAFTSRDWIGEVDVPTAVVACTNDQLVPHRRQVKLARSIPGATEYTVESDHFAITKEPERFVPALVEACRDVAGRPLGTGAAAGGRPGA